MKLEQEPKNVTVPQYEEYRSTSWIAAMSQWMGGIGLVVLGIQCICFPEATESIGISMGLAAGICVGLFLIPAIRGRSRSRENQEISRRNRERYNRYRRELEKTETQ